MPKFAFTAALAAISLALWLSLVPGTAFAETVVWEGNGTVEGVCENIGEFDDLEPGVGEQGWLFILTSPDNAAWELTATFDPDGTLGPITGEQMGGGSVHFVVYTSAGATLESASVTGGTSLSVLTVSHCETGTGEPTLLIHKQCEGGAGTFSFSLDPDGDPVGPHLVNCGGTSDPITLEPDTEYTLTENDPPSEAWTLTEITCNVDFETAGSSVVFTALADTLIECTFVNTFAGEGDPTLVIHKLCEGAEGEFSFLLDPNGDPAGPYEVDCGASSDPITLVPDTEYTLTENALAAGEWELIDFDCNIAFEATESGVVFTATPAAPIECTATNELTIRVIVLQDRPRSPLPSGPATSSGGGGGGGGSSGGDAAPAATAAPVAEVEDVRSLPTTGSGGPVSGGSPLIWVLVPAAIAALALGFTGALARGRRGTR